MSTLVLDSASRWFGNVVAVNDVSLSIGPGVTGLLGPNGAGKTTLMAMMSGFLAPSAGHVTLDGQPVWRNTEAYRQIGLVPERELSFGYLTGRQFVRANADLHRLRRRGRRHRADPRGGRHGRARRPTPRHLLQGHAPAHQDRGGPGPRPDRPAARRAVQRRRPASADAPDGPAAAARRRGPHGALQLPHPRGGRAARPAHRGRGLRPARRLRRLRRDPPADDRPAGAVRRPVERRPRPRLRADGAGVGALGQPARRPARRPGRSTSAASPWTSPGWPGSTT